jgi:hypothetical protein
MIKPPAKTLSLVRTAETLAWSTERTAAIAAISIVGHSHARPSITLEFSEMQHQQAL